MTLNNNNNNNKRHFVRRRNMSVDITRAPYRQSGNVVREGSLCCYLFQNTWCCYLLFQFLFRICISSINDCRCYNGVTHRPPPRLTLPGPVAAVRREVTVSSMRHATASPLGGSGRPYHLGPCRLTCSFPPPLCCLETTDQLPGDVTYPLPCWAVTRAAGK